MANLTLIQKYDAILDALYEISGKRPTYNRIKKVLRVKDLKIEEGEIWDILVKMETEKTVHLPVLNPNPKFPNEYLHLITFEGKLLKERGGLKSKIKRDNFTKTRITILEIATFLLAVITLFYTTCNDNDKELKKMNEILKERLLVPINNTPVVPPAVNHIPNPTADTLDTVPVKK